MEVKLSTDKKSIEVTSTISVSKEELEKKDEALSHTIESLNRQIDIIADRRDVFVAQLEEIKNQLKIFPEDIEEKK